VPPSRLSCPPHGKRESATSKPAIALTLEGNTMQDNRLKVCPACHERFDTWDPREFWGRQSCLSTRDGITHYEAYNASLEGFSA